MSEKQEDSVAPVCHLVVIQMRNRKLKRVSEQVRFGLVLGKSPGTTKSTSPNE